MREGLIPAVLGTAVTATGIALQARDMKRKHGKTIDTKAAIGAGIVGFGLAHIVLGAIDLISDDE